MNYGPLSVGGSVEWSGYGWPSVGAPARSLPTHSVRAMTPPPGSFGRVSRPLTVKAYCIRIIWRATTTSCLPASIRPATGQRVRLIAGFGGFLGRKHDGHPGPKAIWEGMQKVSAFAITLKAGRAVYDSDG